MALGATLTRTLEAVITADASRFSREMGDATRSADTFAGKLQRGIGKAAPFAAAGLAAFGAAAVAGLQGVMDDEKALANFENSIKATGNAVNVNSKAFWRYAEAQQASTGVGADQIAQGAALLATFKNVRNEVGKGNDIFMRATTAAQDLSAKGFGSLEGANKMLGKALNDPIKGISALSRAGVTFTEGQKEQIKAMVEAGDVLGAQKIILGEVESQVGGAAKAYGQTTAGQVQRAKLAFGELTETLAVALLPIIQTLLGVFNRFATWLQENEKVAKIAAIAFVGLSTAILAVNTALKIAGAISALSNPIVLIGVAIAAVVAGVILLYNKSETFREIVTGAWEAVQRVVETVVDLFAGPVKAAFNTISGIVRAIGALLRGDFSGAWEALKDAASGAIDWIKSTILALPLIILNGAIAIGGAIVNGIKDGLASLGSKVWDSIKAMPSALLGFIGGWAEGLKTIGGKVIDYIKSGVTGLASAAWESITNMPSALLGLVGGWADGLAGIGGRIITYIKNGVTGLAGAIWDKIEGFPEALLELLGKAARGIKSIGSSIKDWIVEGLSGIGDAIKSAVLAPVRWIASKIVNNWPDIPGLPGPPGFLKNLQTVGLATGGIVTGPTNALIGEAGAEAVLPLTGNRGRAALAAAMRDAGAGGGAGQTVINLTFNGVLDAREAARRIQPELDKLVSLI